MQLLRVAQAANHDPNVAARHVLSVKPGGFIYRNLKDFQTGRESEKEIEMAGSGNEDWRKYADTHKMSPEEVRRSGVEGSKRPPGHNPGGVLHQRRNLPFSNTTMAVAGFLIVATVGYLTLYAKKKPEANARDVAKVSANVARPEDTHPRK